MTLFCDQCQFYRQTDSKKKLGLCEIKLPAWIEREELTKKKANIVAAQEGCDLGQPIDDEEL